MRARGRWPEARGLSKLAGGGVYDEDLDDENPICSLSFSGCDLKRYDRIARKSSMQIGKSGGLRAAAVTTLPYSSGFCLRSALTNRCSDFRTTLFGNHYRDDCFWGRSFPHWFGPSKRLLFSRTFGRKSLSSPQCVCLSTLVIFNWRLVLSVGNFLSICFELDCRSPGNLPRL